MSEGRAMADGIVFNYCNVLHRTPEIKPNNTSTVGVSYCFLIDLFACEMITHINMFGALVICIVLAELDSALLVFIYYCGLQLREAQLSHHLAHPNNFLTAICESHIFCFCCGQRD